MHGKSIEEIAELCLEQILLRKPSGSPFLPRIIIVGLKESGSFVTASALSKKFGVVHGKIFIANKSLKHLRP